MIVLFLSIFVCFIVNSFIDNYLYKRSIKKQIDSEMNRWLSAIKNMNDEDTPSYIKNTMSNVLIKYTESIKNKLKNT